jgi:hypothetical protein
VTVPPAFPVFLKVHDSKHAARPDRAFNGGALSARHPAKHRHDIADVRLSRARRRDNRARRFLGERFPPGRHGLPCHVEIARYPHWAAFEDWRRAAGRRLVLLTTKARLAYTAFSYSPNDILLFGRESAGVPAAVHAAADACLVIPLKPPMRSPSPRQWWREKPRGSSAEAFDVPSCRGAFAGATRQAKNGAKTVILLQ